MSIERDIFQFTGLLNDLSPDNIGYMKLRGVTHPVVLDWLSC